VLIFALIYFEVLEYLKLVFHFCTQLKSPFIYLTVLFNMSDFHPPKSAFLMVHTKMWNKQKPPETTHFFPKPAIILNKNIPVLNLAQFGPIWSQN